MTRAQEIHFEAVEGLSHNTVFAIDQDDAGFVWIGTSDGLNRYDGYDFTVFRNVPGDTTSLSNNAVKSLLSADEGVVLVGTDDGLNRFEPSGPHFSRIALMPPGAGVEQVAIHRLVQDSQERVWVVSDHGVFRMDSPASRAAHRVELPMHSPADSMAAIDAMDATDAMDAKDTEPGHDSRDAHGYTRVRPWSLFEDADGDIWLGSNEGWLLRLDRSRDAFRAVVRRSGLQLSVHEQADTGELWLTETDRLGLLAFESSVGSFLTPARLAESVDLSRRTIHTIRRDSHGFVWLGTDDGLLRLDPRTNSVDRARPVRGLADFLRNNVKTLFEDRAGALWVGTFSGLYRIDPNRKRFAHLGHDPADPNSLSGSTVMAVAEGRDRQVWVGTLGGGLNLVDPDEAKAVRFLHYPADPTTVCSDLVWSLLLDSSQTLWVGTDQGLCSRSKGSDRFELRYLPTHRARQPPVNALREDRDGNIWAATNIGLYRIRPESPRAQLVVSGRPDAAGADSVLFLQSMHLARNGEAWVGAFGGALYRFDPDAANVRLEPVELDVTGHGELVSEGIWAIHEDDDGSFWLGSDLGLTHFGPTVGTTEHINQSDGLPGSIVYSIVPDEMPGYLWLATNRGLVRFDVATQTARVFDMGDGLVNTEFNRRAGALGADGTVYFGGLNGLTWFSPSDIRDNPHVPPVLITRIERSRRDTTVLVNPTTVDELVLSYRDYTVSFAYTALNFTNPSQNQYAYRLDGFDDQWVQAGARRFATYTNIPPGDYTFRVRGSNDDGLWSKVDATLPISVAPPPWQTAWFRLGVLLLVTALLLGAHRYRVNRLLEVERLRVRIAGDLHDDIGSNLSSIALLSDMVRRRGVVGDRERRHLTRISNSARTMVDTLRDIVWSIDPELDTLSDLIRRMRDTAAILLPGVEWVFHPPDERDTGRIDMVVRRELFLAYKETLHNVARHADATKVEITLARDGEEFRLLVTDNGRGFRTDRDNDEPSINSGRGLRSVRERAEKLGGHVDIHSTPGQGTTVSFTIPSIRKPT